MNMIQLVIVFLFLIQGLSLSASTIDQLNGDRVLKKLSYQLRGKMPEPKDYLELQKARAKGSEAEFFAIKRQEYILTKDFSQVINHRLSNLFYLNPEPVNFFGSSSIDFAKENILNLFFLDLAENNRPWREIFTSKSYPLSQVEVPIEDGNLRLKLDADFFSLINPSSSELDKVTFSEGDPRIAGAFTTYRFQSRFTTTELNKNRRRAAAVFRIGLCDSMSAAVVLSEDRSEELFELVFPKAPHQGLSVEQLEQQLSEDPHGRDPACMNCHFKLDPMGQTFVGVNSKLSPGQFSGALSFKNKEGKKVFIEGRGLGDVMNSLVQQPEYLECQSERLARWVLGNDRYLPQDRLKEFKQAFVASGERIKDYISFLVQQPEFSSVHTLTEPERLSLKAREILKRCDSCHGNGTLPTPPLSVWPLGGSSEASVHWLSKINQVLDLNNGGVNPTMPPSFAGWNLSKSDLQDLKLWIELGAPDENGAPMSEGMKK